MRKIYCCLLLCFSCAGMVSGQDRSPGGFLGYEPGSRFTYHHRIVDYFRFLAGHHPDRVRLLEYGATYEGRPLLVAVVGAARHIGKLDEVRNNHLARIGLSEEKATRAEQPAIAWMSYNVHGDEAATSEAAMQVMYALLEQEHQSILEHSLVILDPCLNPDGHSRYVEGYNRMLGSLPDPSPVAREHFQPWPGGRYNHYLFDLNRDWAWQVQKESRQRLALYRKWMPHLHADFHEMGAGSTYYFPPAARPFHEDITVWQREFNVILGEHNRRYFDEKYWLYFTRTSFDLFYPSYGDTWPGFNGAIGMTYEQGGGGRAGLALDRPDFGDTLTLKDRISHHVTASHATLEALVANKERTLAEFESFFRKAKEQPVGKYRTYMVKVKGQETHLRALESFLDKQGIRYGRAGEAFNAQAAAFATGKTARVSFEAEDLLISAHQPHSRLLKVLFENNPPLEDSLTYDLTSWGIGYVFGFDVYGLEQEKKPGRYLPAGLHAPLPGENAYAYLVDWDATPHLRFLCELLKNKVKVRTANREFEINGRVFAAGTLVLTRAGNEALGRRFDKLVAEAAKKHKVGIAAVTTGMVTRGNDLGSGQVKLIKRARIGLLAGTGISPTAFGSVWHFVDRELEYPITLLEKEKLDARALLNFDVLILPDGNYDAFLTDELLSVLNHWVTNGGRLVAMEGALESLVEKKGLGLLRKKEELRSAPESPLKPYAGNRREALSDKPAGGIYEVSLDTTHPLGFGYAKRPYYTSVRNSYHLAYLPDGWNVGYLGSDAYRSGFVGVNARERLKNTLIFGVRELGSGSVVYMADDPVFRGFWENGKLLFGNALFR